MIWYMNILLIVLIVAGIVGLIATTRTRSAQIARMAKTNGCRYEREKNSITTEQTAGRLEFFTQYFHQYQNVCTCTDDFAFIRVADDNIYRDDNPKTKPVKFTIFTAELKKRQFPALKIAPIDSPFAPSQYALMKTNIPQIDSRYRIHAPTPAAALVLTPFIIGLLKTRANIYMELNDNALVYHENAQMPLAEFQQFRFRAIQILHEFENVIVRLDEANPSTTATLVPKAQDEAELRAEAMMKALCTVHNPASSKASGWRGIWIVALLAVLLGMSLLSWVVLSNWLPR